MLRGWRRDPDFVDPLDLNVTIDKGARALDNVATWPPT